MQAGRILAFCKGAMFLRSNKRIKDGKEHRYYTVVESRRLRSGKVAQRQVLYLGEINDSQQAAWRKTLEVFDEQQCRYTPLSLFPEDRPVPADAVDSVQVKLSEMKLERARPYGNCWLGCELWRQLQLDRFWPEKLPKGRESVAWAQVLELLVVNRLIDPGGDHRLDGRRKQPTPRQVGLAGGLSGYLLSERVPVAPDGNRARGWLALADRLAVPAQQMGAEFEPTEEATRSAEQLLLSKGVGDGRLLVAIAPGQGFADAAVAAWGAERFAHLANRLATRHGAGVILVGDARDRRPAEAMRLDLAADTVDLCGELDLGTTAAVIARCDLLIAADTPLLHLAAAVGTASVGLFGPTSGRARAPAGVQHRVVQALPNGTIPASLDGIRVDDVLAGIESAL